MYKRQIQILVTENINRDVLSRLKQFLYTIRLNCTFKKFTDTGIHLRNVRGITLCEFEKNRAQMCIRDSGMIDGISNNGPKEDKTAEVKAPERGEKSSIMDRLKSAKAEKQKECCPCV